MKKYICDKKTLAEFLQAELPAYGRASRYLQWCPLLVHEGQILYKIQKRLRRTEYYLNTGKRVRATIGRLALNRLMLRYGMHLPLNVFDKGLHIMHLGPILVNKQAAVGKNCALHINTAIVAGGSSGQVPRLGDGVVVGVGAVILGGVTIADNVAIGANAVVNKSVEEPGIAVAGVPARKISNNGRQTWGK